jgi:site-specific recombinase XerD
MGPALMRHPPKFVQGFIDRHGKPRFYFRRAGFKAIPLPGLPWSPEFMAAYEHTLAGQPMQIGAERVKPGTLRALAVSYFNSAAFNSLKAGTQRARRRVVDRLCEQVDQDGHTCGDKSAATMQREHVVKMMAARAAKPESANALRKALRQLMQHAIDTGVRSDDPTRDVKKIKPTRKGGHHSWTEEEIGQFEDRHPIGTRPRLALALLIYSGQRKSDVVRMGPQHVRGGTLQVRQDKTDAELAIPVHPTLAAIIAASEGGHLAFLMTQFGRPFTANGFGNWFREQCDMANLHHCSAHGLRKAAARRLAEAGCSEHEIAAITGHASLAELRVYTKAVNQKRLAESAMAKVKA